MSKLYTAYLKNKNNAEFFTHLKTVMVEHEGQKYRIIFTRKRANRYSIIHCRGNSIAWEQHPMVPRLVGRTGLGGDRIPVAQISPSKDAVTLFIIKGKPNSITGLDEGIFRSVHKFDKKLINVMSEARFKEL